MPPRTASAGPRTSGVPRTLVQLAGAPMGRRSDYAAWCQGWRVCCDQLSAIAMAMEAELYQRLLAKHGRDYDARSVARKATRPLRIMASAAHLAGRLGPRAYRAYAAAYASEMSPKKQTAAKFDHRS